MSKPGMIPGSNLLEAGLQAAVLTKHPRCVSLSFVPGPWCALERPARSIGTMAWNGGLWDESSRREVEVTLCQAENSGHLRRA